MSTSIDSLTQTAATIRSCLAEVYNRPPEEIGIEPISGDASTRQYFRARLDDGRSFIVAKYPEAFDPETLNYCDVTRLFHAAGLPVPQLHHASGPLGLIVQEDLGDLRMQDWMAEASLSDIEAAYRQAVELIVRIQDATALAHELGSIASRLAFDEEKLLWELNFFYRHYLGHYLQRSLPDDLTTSIQTEFQALAGELASLPRVLCHRDYHSRNLMVRANELVIIDHQDARLGPRTYDLVSLLEDPYADLESDLVARLRQHFVERCNSTSGKAEEDDRRRAFDHEYAMMSVQRLVKAIGTYAYQTAVMGNDVYAPYIPRARRRALAELRIIDRFPALDALLLLEGKP